MNEKHLFWIVPLALIAGFLSGSLVVSEANNQCMNSLIGSVVALASCERAVDVCVVGEVSQECYTTIRDAERERLTP